MTDDETDIPAADLPPRHHSATLTEYSPGKLTDQALCGIYQSCELWAKQGAAPALATELGRGLMREIKRRHNNLNPDNVPQEPDLLEFHFERWSDRDVGEAMLLTTVFSYGIQHVECAELMDELVNVFSQCAADRLRESADPRNATHCWERWHTPEEVAELIRKIKPNGTEAPE